MHYHPRILEQKVKEYWDAFPCVLLAGARQVGKSTMLARLFAAKAKTFTFDPVQDLFGEFAARYPQDAGNPGGGVVCPLPCPLPCAPP